MLKYKFIYTIVLCLAFSFNYCAAQDSLIVHEMIRRIADQQVSNDKFFMQGIFPSYISNKPRYSKRKKDNNIFYNALIIYTLNNVRSELNVEDQKILDSIIIKSEKLFTQFKNRKERETYNFWRTDSAYKFPYTWWIPLIKKNTAIADDLDCTALCLLALNAPDSTAKKVHALMQAYVNDPAHPTKTSSSVYKSYPAYSTWFGKKFPVVFDVSVLANVLTFVQTYNLKWTKADSASLQLIINSVRNGDYITKPLLMSPYYGRTSVILYHLARLMYVKPLPQLEDLKDSLINEAKEILIKTKDPLEKILLTSALLKWNASTTPVTSLSFNNIEKSNLPFFIGNIPSYLKHQYKRVLTENKVGLFYYYCSAFNDALLVEYLLLEQKRKVRK